MRLDEAILHCEEIADKCGETQCGTDHRQLAEWLKELKRLKTFADAVPAKIGKWEEREVFSARVVDELQSARCSVCGKYHTTPYTYYFYNYAYCPNCGEKMEIPV